MGLIDDRFGPMGMGIIVIMALFSIFIISLVDLIAMSGAKPNDGPHPPLPAPGNGGSLLHWLDRV